MIKKIVTKRTLNESSTMDDLAFWLSKFPEERVAAVDYLRKQYHGNTERLQRTARVVYGRTEFILNKRAAGRKKDTSDLEALGEE